jgi:uncharacterized membrane protein YccC
MRATIPGTAWLRRHDRDLGATRRAARAAIAIPLLLALCDEVLDAPVTATFAVFGSFALLVLVGFAGSLADRLLSEALLAAAGAVLVCVGTLLSGSTVLAVAGTAVVGFVVILSGVVSSTLAASTVSLLLAFVLPVSLPGGASSLPDRLEGWGLATGVALLAVGLLWPAPSRDPLRAAAAAACRAAAARLRADAAAVLAPPETAAAAARERDEATAAADAALGALTRTFYASPFHPTALSTAARSIVRLVDELAWLGKIVAKPSPAGVVPDARTCAVRTAAADALDDAAAALEGTGHPAATAAAGERLRAALAAVEDAATVELPARWAEERPGDVTAFDPAFRAQELSFAVGQIAANADRARAADGRSLLDRLLGRRPEGLPGPLGAADGRLRAHLDPHSVWLHNSLRGAAGLALSVLVATESGVQHSFWVVLGTLSVLRSNALNTGQNALLAVLGTAAGFVVAAGLLVGIGTNHTVLWVLLPPAILLAGLAPAAISFTAGQAAFTILLVLVFNLLAPSGWRVGLLRVEDIAIGCGVSVLVGLLFWPRGATAVLRTELGEAYEAAVGYLVAAVDHGVEPHRPAPAAERDRAAAAARRLDDAFRTYLAEGGEKPVPLAETTTLVTGVAALRLAADAVGELWRRPAADGRRDTARGELTAASDRVAGWYRRFASALLGAGHVPEPLGPDTAADGRLVAALRTELVGEDGQASGDAVRLVWTADHLDAARRLQAALAEPGRRLATVRPSPLRPRARGAAAEAPAAAEA